MSDSSYVCGAAAYPPQSRARGIGDLLLMFLLLCLSGNPAVTGQDMIQFIYAGTAVFLAVLLLVRQGRLLTLRFGVVISIFAGILAVQVVSFSFFPAVTIVGFFVRVFIGYAVVMLIRDFARTYLVAMVILAIFSFVFYIPEQIGHMVGFDVGGLFGDMIARTAFRREMFFYSFWRDVSYRNPGIFWEPGAFAGYLNLALIFLAVYRDRLSRRAYVWYLIVLSCALFTTLSTAGYVVYPLVLILHARWKLESREKAAARLLLGMYVVLPIAVGLCIYCYRNLEFMQEKINRESNAVEYSQGRWYRGRMGSLVFDWDYIKSRPLTGWGLHAKTRYALHPGMESSEGMGNGMSDFMAKFGVTGMLVFLVAAFQGMMFLTGRVVWRSMLTIAILLLVLQGEVFLGLPLFLGLMFLRPSNSSREVPRCATGGLLPEQMFHASAVGVE